MKEEIKYRIKNIDLLEGALNQRNKPLNEDQVFSYDINLEHKVNLLENTLIIICQVTVTSINKEETFGKYKVGCIFEIEELEKYRNKGTTNIDLPNNLVIALNSITISTTRGMMAGFFRGTYLHNAILPLLDPASFSKEQGS